MKIVNRIHIFLGFLILLVACNHPKETSKQIATTGKTNSEKLSIKGLYKFKISGITGNVFRTTGTHCKIDTLTSDSLFILTNFGDKLKVNNENSIHIRTKSNEDTLNVRLIEFNTGDTILHDEKKIKIQDWPRPIASIGWNLPEKLNKNILLRINKFTVDLLNYDIDFGPMKVKSYTVLIIRNNQLLYINDFSGNNFSDKLKNDFASLIETNDRVIFTNIVMNENALYRETDLKLNSIEKIIL